MTIFEPTFWLCGIALWYVAIDLGVAAIALAARARKPVPGLLAPFIAAAGWLAARDAHLLPGATVLGSAGIAYLGAVTAGRLLTPPGTDWRLLRYRSQVAKQAAIHLALITGAVLFFVPFAWLVVTSLKEDSEMSRFPPVWIPTQQTTVMLHGQEDGLAWAPYRAQRVKVGVVQEFDTGDRLVEIVAPPALAGTQFRCAKGELTEIRHFAPVWKNYSDALTFLPPETDDGLVFLWNTLLVSALSVVGTLLSSAMVAYSFARLRWPGRDALFLVLLATMMLPAAVTMMPVFLIFRALGWIDTLRPLWVPAFFGSAFYIFMLRQFFLSIPMELEEAARIDGCSYSTTFWRIMLPQVKPALAAVAIMVFMGAWNDFRGPLIYVSSPEKETLAYGLQLFQTAHSGEPALLMAASTMVVIPVVLLFFFTQRYFIQGITLTGIKG